MPSKKKEELKRGKWYSGSRRNPIGGMGNIINDFHKENRNKLYMICRSIGQQYLPSRGETRIGISEMYLPLDSNHPSVPPLHSIMLNKYHSALRI